MVGTPPLCLPLEVDLDSDEDLDEALLIGLLEVVSKSPPVMNLWGFFFLRPLNFSLPKTTGSGFLNTCASFSFCSFLFFFDSGSSHSLEMYSSW